MKYIASRANASVRLTQKLLGKRGREVHDAFLIEGFVLVREAVASGLEVTHVFYRGDAPDDVRAADTPGAEISALSETLFDEIADTVTPQSVMAVVKRPRRVRVCDGVRRALRADPDGAAILVLDRLSDPGNAGTAIRTAEAAGFGGVIAVKGTVDVYAPKVVRSAAGALFRTPVLLADSSAEAVTSLRNEGFRLASLHMEDGAPYDAADLTGDIAIVVGNESAGIDAVFLSGADVRVSIPMRAGSESLNAGVAASIVMYERVRQLRAVGSANGSRL